SSYARGAVEALLAPGRARVDPVCAVFGSCGGCAWQHVDYAAQLDAKREIAAAALRRIGGLALPEGEALPITPSPSPYRYRTRSRVLVEAGKVGYRRRRSHALAPTSRCPVLVEALEQRLASLAADPPRCDGEWELVASLGAELPRRDRDGELVASLGAEPAARALPLPAAEGPRIWLRVGGDRIGVSPGVFVQSNASLLEPLARAVAGAAGAGRLALELYCGAGFFTLGLARSFEQVVAVDANPAAVRDLEHNLRDAQLANVRARTAAVEAALDEPELARLRPDCVVVDPPRAGLGERVAARIAALAPARIVYLSCDPATLARDLSHLDHRGYALLRAECFDLFPQTPHVEVLAVATARSGSGSALD
ncbi:MAG TPA: RsmD family RNA methyltransferase, partial [Myxococcota bacterium]|nr:RsmD family RNA methyltransferase [Myxococcota bacterium]